jgi:uncharacterized RDD family membrane protein YckC
LLQWTPDHEAGTGLAAALPSVEMNPEVAVIPCVEAEHLKSTEQSSPGSDLSASDTYAREAAPAWRDELSARLDRYRARRKVRPPRYPSLNLRFEAPEMYANAKSANASSLADFETVSNQALALDGMASTSSAMAEAEKEYPTPAETAPAPVPSRPSRPAGAKVIEFPRFAWAPPTPPPDQLAEPVSERPRILDVPEFEPPAPALGGILIEAVEQPDPEKRLGIDIPLQSAPLGLRLVAALVDGLIIAAAASLFGFIFWKVDAIRPPMVQTLSLAAGLLSLFWAAYQYLLIVYSASTPGLRIAGLELARFNGTSTSRSLRRWRVLASWLSAVSAGMGYVWVFLDEDALCWHDRITHTYLAPRRCEPKTRD